MQNLTVLDICNSMNSLKLNCYYHLKQKSPVSVINHSCRWPLQQFRVIQIFIVNIMFFSFTVFVFCNSAKYLQLSLLWSSGANARILCLCHLLCHHGFTFLPCSYYHHFFYFGKKWNEKKFLKKSWSFRLSLVLTLENHNQVGYLFE